MDGSEILKKVIKFIGSILIITVGSILGAIIAFYGTFYFCLAYDYIMSSSLTVVGWIFCMITMPWGFIIGGYAGWKAYLAIINKNVVNESKDNKVN